MKKNSTKDRLNVVFHLDFFPHYRGPLAKELLKSPNHNWILAGEKYDVRNHGLKTWPIPSDASFIHLKYVPLWGRIGWQKGSVGLAFRKDIDVIVFHSHWRLLNVWIAAPLARLFGKRVLFYTMGWYRKQSILSRIIRKLFFTIPHGLCLYGRWAKCQGILSGYSAKKLHVVYNSLDYKKQKTLRSSITDDRVREIRMSLFNDLKTPIAIRTGRLIKRAAINQLFQAVLLLKQKNKKINILLVGDGPEKIKLQKLARELEINVCFYGACYDEEELAELIVSSNMTVSPGMTGLTSIHSCAYGTPVITHDDPWNQMPEWEIVHEELSGSLHKRGDIESIASSMERWLQPEIPTKESREKCAWLLEKIYNSRTRRRAFDWAVSGKEANDLFYIKDQEGPLGPIGL